MSGSEDFVGWLQWGLPASHRIGRAFLGFIAMGATLWLLNHALTPNATWYLNNEGIPLGGRNVLPYMAIVFLVFPAVGIIVAVMLFRRITKPKPNDSP